MIRRLSPFFVFDSSATLFLLDKGWFRVQSFRVQSSKFLVVVSGLWFLVCGFWFNLHEEFPGPSQANHEAENETRNQKPETTNQKPQTRNHKPETRNHTPETSNHEPGTLNFNG